MSITVNMNTTDSSLNSLLKEIFMQVFKVSEVQDRDSMETILLWDSFGHMELITAIEYRFGIRIEPEEMVNLTSVLALKEYLRKVL